MMKRAAVLLAEGFEEGESLFTVDILRRCGVGCDSVSIGDEKVTGCNSITAVADRVLGNSDLSEYDMVVLPGGMPGAKNLKEDPRVISIVQSFMKEGKYVAAICAAPMVLAEAGVSNGRRLTSYPADKYRDLFKDAEYVDDEIVVQDGNLITSRGPATVLPFAYKLAEVLGGDADTVKKRMLYPDVIAWEK